MVSEYILTVVIVLERRETKKTNKKGCEILCASVPEKHLNRSFTVLMLLCCE